MQMPVETESPPSKRRRALKVLKQFYLIVHFLLVMMIFASAGAIYIAFRPDGLEIVRTYVFTPLGIRYTRAEGSLLKGFTLHQLRSDKFKADSLSAVYDLPSIMKGKHIVESISIEGLQIHIDDFLSDESTPWPFPNFILKEVTLNNLQLISDYPVELDFKGKNGFYDGDDLSFSSFAATLRSKYSDAVIQGTIVRNSIAGNALLYPNLKALSPYTDQWTAVPETVPIKIEKLSDSEMSLSAILPTLPFRLDETLKVSDIALHFFLDYENDFFDLQTAYNVKYQEHSAKMAQKLRYRFDGTLLSSFDGKLSSSFLLPSDHLQGTFEASDRNFESSFTLSKSRGVIRSTDYEKFEWSLQGDESLAFITSLPEDVKNTHALLDAKGNYDVSAQTAHGKIVLENPFLHLDGNLSASTKLIAYKGKLTLPTKEPHWEKLSRFMPTNFDTQAFWDINGTHLHLSNPKLQLSASLKEGQIKGSGSYLNTFVDLRGSVQGSAIELNCDTITPSLLASLNAYQPIALSKGEHYDAEIQTHTRIRFDHALQINSNIHVPWYAAILDSQRQYSGIDNTLNVSYDGGKIILTDYRLDVADHIIASPFPSYLHLEDNNTLIAEDVRVFDTLKMTGWIDLNSATADLHFDSPRFSYKGPEGKAHLAADLHFTRNEQEVHKLDGEIKILDASITYLPLQKFKVMDDDIIIIQDVRPPSPFKLGMNVHVTTSKPISYTTKELDLLLKSDITLWRELQGPIQMLGMVQIPTGNVQTGGKQFEIKPSAIYFGGETPLNPYLELIIGHEVDYKKIIIYITHTLDSPIFLFSSDPVMSQNDIMSYILFGSPANTALNSDGSSTTMRADATSMMLGAGLKGLISNTTKIQIDTMNILTSEEGGMGVEIGAKLHKNLRVLYKNDTLSSLLLQYQVNRWLRLDAHIRELGQGINALYIKDFKDFLPHNPPKK